MCGDWPGRDEKEACMSDWRRRPALLERQVGTGRSKDAQIPEWRSVHVNASIAAAACIHYVMALCNYNPTSVWILFNIYSTSSSFKLNLCVLTVPRSPLSQFCSSRTEVGNYLA